jgi:hypothetical protein
MILVRLTSLNLNIYSNALVKRQNQQQILGFSVVFYNSDDVITSFFHFQLTSRLRFGHIGKLLCIAILCYFHPFLEFV